MLDSELPLIVLSMPPFCEPPPSSVLTSSYFSSEVNEDRNWSHLVDISVMKAFGISINNSRILSFVLLTLLTAGNNIGIERITMQMEAMKSVNNKLVFSRALTYSSCSKKSEDFRRAR